MDLRLDISYLMEQYSVGVKPVDIIDSIYDRIEASPPHPVWITLVPRADALVRAASLRLEDKDSLPLYGIPFAVKDNIDVAGMPTTAGCPAYAAVAKKSATVVTKLIDAGAILIGKTNLDQFATGLVGLRSPYGACSSVFNSDYISGGSSSGSAVSVATGLVSFALGTDTAGSGRVPAAFNNIVGLKPTRGIVSTHGVVPACRSLDCISIFSLTVSDAAAVFNVAVGADERDPYSRIFDPDSGAAPWLKSKFRFGVPRQDQWQFFGDDAARELYAGSIARLQTLGGIAEEFDYSPLHEIATLLYQGPWVAERLASIEKFYAKHRDSIDPVVGSIIDGAKKFNAVEAFQAQYRLEELRVRARKELSKSDFLLLPTTPTAYTIEAVLADPIRLNSNLGYYTNFVNLLDLAAVAVPAGFRPNGLPFGVTVIGKSHSDRALLSIADQFHRSTSACLGRTAVVIDQTPPLETTSAPPGCTIVSVVGAHLSGQPLNHQLTSRGARLMETSLTSQTYRLYALPNTVPQKPGLVRTATAQGHGIEIEIWAMPTRNFGSFVSEIPAPLGIGVIETIDGRSIKGFICEPAAIEGAQDITEHGSWRSYLKFKTAVS